MWFLESRCLSWLSNPMSKFEIFMCSVQNSCIGLIKPCKSHLYWGLQFRKLLWAIICSIFLHHQWWFIITAIYWTPKWVIAFEHHDSIIGYYNHNSKKLLLQRFKAIHVWKLQFSVFVQFSELTKNIVNNNNMNFIDQTDSMKK